MQLDASRMAKVWIPFDASVQNAGPRKGGSGGPPSLPPPPPISGSEVAPKKTNAIRPASDKIKISSVIIEYE